MPIDKLEMILEDMDRFINRQIVGLTLRVHKHLTIDTPLDVGWARANWVPQLTAPYRVNLLGLDPDSGMAASQRANAQAALTAIATSYRMELGSIFLSNNVPYIGRLNDGHSPQAPPGYVQVSIQTAVRSFSI